MGAHVLLNLLNKLGNKIRCKALQSILSVLLCRASYQFSPTSFNKFNITGPRMQDSVYHMTLKLHSSLDFCTKTSRFRHKYGKPSNSSNTKK